MEAQISFSQQHVSKQPVCGGKFDSLFDPKEYHPEENESFTDIGIPMEVNDYGIPLKTNANNKSYDDIVAKLERSNKLFVDAAFPPNDSSIFMEAHSRRSNVQWMRASELSGNPKFIKEEASRFDINQGKLGDCWFLAAVGNLTLKPKLFKRVVPMNQSFDEGHGIYKFNFFRFGEWVEVVVDDYLPTLNGELIFMKSDSSDEFWSSLLEKAYAKLNGCYESLSGGLINEAMVDFSGGCPEFYDLSRPEGIPKNMFQIMQEATKRNSMMGAGILPDAAVYENQLENGLVQGHAYSVTGITTVSVKNASVNLIRIRNPWGNAMEWRGAWSDGSVEWKNLSVKEKERLKYEKNEDGEYYMDNDEFLKQFDFLEVCHLTEDSLEEKDTEKGKLFWYKKEFHGSWIVGKSAGGCANNFLNFVQNPQFKLVLNEDQIGKDGTTTVIVSLMQKMKMRSGSRSIGFVIFRVKDELELPLKMDELLASEIVGFTDVYYNLREVNKRFTFKKGSYLIVPSTFEPGVAGEFLLRVFSENSHNLEASEEYIPQSSKTVFLNFV